MALTGGSIQTQPTHLIDVFPTALAAAQTQYRGGQPLPGRDLILQLQEPSADRMLFFEHQGNRAVRQGHWKLVALDDAPWELYDLRADRIESIDLAARLPNKVKELDTAWIAWADRNHVTPLPKDLKVKYLKPD